MYMLAWCGTKKSGIPVSARNARRNSVTGPATKRNTPKPSMRILPSAPQRSTSAPAPSVRNENRAGPPVAETRVAVAASPITASVLGSDASTYALWTSPSTSSTCLPVADAICPATKSP